MCFYNKDWEEFHIKTPRSRIKKIYQYFLYFLLIIFEEEFEISAINMELKFNICQIKLISF